jgi:hypothetical protein
VKHHRSPEQQSHGDCVRRRAPLGCGATPTAALRQAQGFGDSPA